MQHERRAAPRMNRRAILKSGLLATLGAGIGTATTSELLGQSPAAHTDADLREKFFGCIAGCHIGSAMGAPVEGWPWDRIEREYGTLDRLLPYQHYGNGWNREPGTTEDGVERQKLIITAILEKQDRVTAEDVRKAWVQHMNPNAAGLVSEPFEGPLLALAKTPIPAADIGKYCDYSGLVSLSRSCHPIGLINAGDIAAAIQDIHDVGQLYHTANSRGIRWAEVTVVGIAAATKTGATLDSVLGAIFDQCDRADQPYERAAGVRRELERGLKLTEGCADFREMRQRFDSMYSGQGLVYAQSYANEIVTKAVCVLRLTRGNTWETMKAGVNMGRDTDCLTAVAAGLAGALTGAGSIPPALLAQTDRATALNPHTNSQRTLRQTADGLHAAYRARLKRLRRFIEEMDAA